MKIEFIERLIKLAERSGLTELEYGENTSVVRFSLHVQAGGGIAPVPLQGASATTVPQAEAVTPAPERGYAVTSSLGGVFYRAPAPSEPAFVQVGDQVDEGQTLAMIEAMKMLNPIESPVTGRILAILINEGEMVESGAPLFMIAEEA